MRRLPETLAYAFPLLAVLFLPIIFGMHDLFHWIVDNKLNPFRFYGCPIWTCLNSPKILGGFHP